MFFKTKLNFGNINENFIHLLLITEIFNLRLFDF